MLVSELELGGIPCGVPNQRGEVYTRLVVTHWPGYTSPVCSKTQNVVRRYQVTDWNITDTDNGSVEIKVNGEFIGTAQPTDILKDVVRQYAQERGLRTFSVYVDGQRLDPSPAALSETLAGRHILEIVAKDVRGI